MSRLEELQALLAESFDAEPGDFKDATTPDDIEGWDSLSHLNMTVSLEERFGIEFSMDNIMDMKDVGTIREILRTHGVAV